MSASAKVESVLQSKVDFQNLGNNLNLHEKLCLELAKEYQRQEDSDYSCISCSNQQKAQDYFNEHGFIKTLNHLCSIVEEN